METQVPEVAVTQASTAMRADISDHDPIRLPPAILLRTGMHANVAVRLGAGRVIACSVVTHWWRRCP